MVSQSSTGASHRGRDPGTFDVVSTRFLGRTFLRPFWAGWIGRLHPLRGGRALDFGSGSGQLSRRLALAVGPSGRLTCLDISDRWLSVARAETGDLAWVQLRRGTPDELPEGFYDLVHVHYVLHDIPRGTRGDTVEALARRLKPGGRLAVREPLYYRSLDVGELVTLCARAGLEASKGPTRRWWLAGPVVEILFRRA